MSLLGCFCLTRRLCSCATAEPRVCYMGPAREKATRVSAACTCRRPEGCGPACLPGAAASCCTAVASLLHADSVLRFVLLPAACNPPPPCCLPDANSGIASPAGGEAAREKGGCCAALHCMPRPIHMKDTISAAGCSMYPTGAHLNHRLTLVPPCACCRRWCDGRPSRCAGALSRARLHACWSPLRLLAHLL